MEKTKYAYLNNTVPYAIAFAISQEVSKICLYGIDFSYKEVPHMAEAGRACTEFWLAIASTKGIVSKSECSFLPFVVLCCWLTHPSLNRTLTFYILLLVR